MTVIDFPSPKERKCRECGIEGFSGITVPGGEPLCWMDEDLCLVCADAIVEAEKRDAARYRYLRNRGLSQAAMAYGGVFAGKVPENKILGGEDLDRAVDAALGKAVETGETLEKRLADCLEAAIDTPLITGRDEVGSFSSPLDLRLGFFLPEIANRAAELLEEAGK